MSGHEELVTQFSDITGIDADQAKFYLESAAWQLEEALVGYYENEDREAEAMDDNEVVVVDSDSGPTVKDTTQEERKGTPKPSALDSLNNDSSDEEEEGQAFYAGGSEHSGQQVIGPGKKKNNIVAKMFRAVQEYRANHNEPGSSRKEASSGFTGVGYKLGQTSNDSEVVKPVGGSHHSGEEVTVTLKMWTEGFSIDDGPLRSYSDPNSRDFLAKVGRGEIPDELIHEANSSEVHLNLEDHSHEKFEQAKPKLKAFSGKGNVLGSPAPSTQAAECSSGAGQTKNEDNAKQAVVLDNSQPTTTIQVRLADGSRLAATLNQSHTISDLRRYILIARPEYEGQSFNLLTSFPSTELSDPSKTLAAAGVLNSVVLQRMK